MSSPPFFNDFIKRTKDFFKRDKYDFGEVVEVKHKNYDIAYTGKCKFNSSDGSASAKLTGLLRQPWGSVEVSQDCCKGSTVEVKKNDVFKGVSGRFKRTPTEAEITLDRRKDFFNWKVKALYQPNKGGHRVCATTISAAVGDDSLNLSVGGEVTLEDRQKVGTPAADGFVAVPQNVASYGVGFLYEPSKQANYSLTFRPQRRQDGLQYSLALMRGVQIDTGNADVAVKVEGNVDTKIAGAPPTATLAARATVAPGLTLNAFCNSHAEWGANYKFAIPADKLSIRAQLGVSSFAGKGGAGAATKFGYKITIE